jgi:hypothetical protein
MPWTAPAINQPSYAQSQAVRGQAIQNKLNEFKTTPEYQNLLTRGMEADVETKEFNLENVKSLAPMQKELLLNDMVLQTGQNVTWENYPQYKASMDRMAADIGLENYNMTDPAEIASAASQAGVTPEMFFEQAFKPHAFTSILERQNAYIAELNAKKAPKGTTSEYERLVEQYNVLPEGDPRRAQIKLRMDKLTEKSKGQIINVGTGTPDKVIEEANKKYGQGVGDRVNEKVKGAQEAVNQNVQLDAVLDAINSGADTGVGEETILNLKSFAQTLGFETKDLGPQELIRKISNEMALRLRNPDSGLGLTGNTSNKDLDFLKASVIGLNRTESGNRMIVDFMKKYNQFRIDIADYQQKLISDNNGSIPSNIDEMMLNYANNYKLLTPEETAETKRLGQKIKGRFKAPDGRTVIVFEDNTRAYANE